MKTAMQQLKEKIQIVIGEMNGELSSYESGYKQCLINIQNDIDDQMSRIEREQMMKTWTKAIDQTKERGWNVIRAYDDFDDFFNETYGGNK